MLTLLKLLTKSGRKAFVRDLLAKYLTVDMISTYVVNVVNELLAKVQNKERLEVVAGNIKNAADLLAKISGAIEDGTVTSGESALIVSSTNTLIGNVVTAEKVDAVINRVVENVV